jgi:hypothetical protein
LIKVNIIKKLGKKNNQSWPLAFFIRNMI